MVSYIQPSWTGEQVNESLKRLFIFYVSSANTFLVSMNKICQILTQQRDLRDFPLLVIDSASQVIFPDYYRLTKVCYLQNLPRDRNNYTQEVHQFVAQVREHVCRAIRITRQPMATFFTSLDSPPVGGLLWDLRCDVLLTGVKIRFDSHFNPMSLSSILDRRREQLVVYVRKSARIGSQYTDRYVLIGFSSNDGASQPVFCKKSLPQQNEMGIDNSFLQNLTQAISKATQLNAAITEMNSIEFKDDDFLSQLDQKPPPGLHYLTQAFAAGSTQWNEGDSERDYQSSISSTAPFAHDSQVSYRSQSTNYYSQDSETRNATNITLDADIELGSDLYEEDEKTCSQRDEVSSTSQLNDIDLGSDFSSDALS